MLTEVNSKIINHKHRKEALHSIEQQRMFFALGAQLNLDEIAMKERAKKKFSHSCFNDLTKNEINTLIDILVNKVEGR